MQHGGLQLVVVCTTPRASEITRGEPERHLIGGPFLPPSLVWLLTDVYAIVCLGTLTSLSVDFGKICIGRKLHERKNGPCIEL